MLQNKCDTEKESISDLYLVGINVEAYGTDLQLVWRGANMGQNPKRQLVKKLILVNRSPCSMSSKDEEGFDGRKVAAMSISVKQALTILDEN